METKSVLVDPQKSSTRLTQFLQKGTHRLVIVAPFDTKILVSPLNPSPGFGFFPDQDQSSEVWNSLLEAPESGNYSFLIQVNRYISDPLHINFIPQNIRNEEPPPVVQPPSPPVQPPNPAPPDPWQRFREQGYRVTSYGSVIYFYVVIAERTTNGKKEVSISGKKTDPNRYPEPMQHMYHVAEVNDDPKYRYTRYGPYPSLNQAQEVASRYAREFMGDSTAFGWHAISDVWEIKPFYKAPSHV